MRLLLVQVPTSQLGAGEKVYPLGLARLAATVPPGVEVRGLDMNLDPDPWPRLRRLLQEFRPDVTALSFRNIDPLAGQHSSYVPALQTAAHLVRRLAPAARILAGGPAFSLFGRRLVAEIPELDGGLCGEAEGIFPRLLAGDPNPGNLPGLVWRDGDAVRRNPGASRVDMDALPAPDTKLFPPSDYLKVNRYVAAMGIEGKRGCDLGCAYCVYPLLGGGRMRLRRPRRIVDEMETLHRDHGVVMFHFTDAVVNRPADHFEAVCREMLHRGLPIQWTGFFREDGLTADRLALAVDSGLAAVYFSGDALTEGGLRRLNKKLTKEDLLRAAAVTAANGVLTMCHFLVNLPGEDEAEAREAEETLDRILDCHATAGNLGAVILNNVRLYPGAPLTRRLLRSGDLDPRADLLYPVYHDPPATAHRLHVLGRRCHQAGVISHLGLN